jgi:plastocyanin
MRRAVLLAVAAIFVGAVAAHAGPVTGTLRLRGRPAADAVVYLERMDGPAPRATPPARVVMDQKNLAFAPRVLPVVEGTTVVFTNSDDIQHNVFSPSRTANAFDLGTYSRGQERSVTMRQAGEVLVLCNIHMEMEARILVLRDPYFAVTDAAGRWTIADVPPGRYAVKVWSRAWVPFERTVEVSGPPATTIDLDG